MDIDSLEQKEDLLYKKEIHFGATNEESIHKARTIELPTSWSSPVDTSPVTVKASFSFGIKLLFTSFFISSFHTPNNLS